MALSSLMFLNPSHEEGGGWKRAMARRGLSKYAKFVKLVDPLYFSIPILQIERKAIKEGSVNKRYTTIIWRLLALPTTNTSWKSVFIFFRFVFILLNFNSST
jgi:hypothetical protein